MNEPRKLTWPFFWCKFSLDNEFILSAWLKSSEHEVVERVNKRLDFATNLEIETAEELQAILPDSWILKLLTNCCYS